MGLDGMGLDGMGRRERGVRRTMDEKRKCWKKLSQRKR
jgi:hypothetical protein